MHPLKSLRVFSIASLALLMVSCGSTSVSLDYKPELSQAMQGPRKLTTGRFADMRRENEFYLGTVRTPIGTPLETLTTRVPVAEVVRNAFAHGLSARKMLVSPNGAPYTLTGEILDLHCDQIVRPGAYAKIRVNVVHTRTGEIVHSRIYQGERESGAYLPGSGSPLPALQELTSRALQDAVDRALDDPSMRARLSSGPRNYGPYGPNVL